MPVLTAIRLRQILDSRGWPTIEAEVTLENGLTARVATPSGASVGTHESLEKRDDDSAVYAGKGVEKVIIAAERNLIPHLLHQPIDDQESFDQEMVLRDGTADLSHFGANAILPISLAVAKAQALWLQIPFFKYVRTLTRKAARHYTQVDRYDIPLPMFNIVNGGAHTRWQTTDTQEFMIVPLLGKKFADKLEIGSEIYHCLQGILKDRNLSTLVGDEGGFAPAGLDDQAIIELIISAIVKAGVEPGQDVALALDPAVSALYEKGQYHPKVHPGEPKSSEEYAKYWYGLTQEYPIISLEDAMAEDDWKGWQTLRSLVGEEFQIVGDDLLVTNPERIAQAIEKKACNTLLMKLNQIGTLSESLHAVAMARSAGWRVIVSHRSGETEDATIADVAVGIGAEFMKSGAPARSERLAKYNQLLRIEEML
jgi:enolase